MAAPAETSTLFRPPAPTPLKKPLSMLGVLRQLRKDPLTTWTQTHFEKPIVVVEGFFGHVAVLSDPAAIRHVLVDNAFNYRKDDLQRRILAPTMGNSLFTAEADEWRVQRRALAPLFARRTVSGFGPAMAVAADRIVQRLRRRGKGREVDIALEMTRVALDVLERTIFTHGVARDPGSLSVAIGRYFEAIGRIDPLDLLGFPDWLPRIARIRSRPALRFFEGLVDELVGVRRALIDGGDTPPNDLMTLLLQAADPETGRPLTDLEVRANIIAFLAAGHETTANALSWSLYLLSQTPDIRDRVEREVDAAGDATEASDYPVTRAVFEEAMRLYPPIPVITRTAIGDDRVAGFRIPKGSFVMIPPYVLHRHKLLWTEPDAFDPDRFMPGRREAIDRLAYLPVGAGPRVCIGASFSIQEGVIVLSRLLRAVRLDMKPGVVPNPLHRVTLRPAGGLPMIIRLR